MLTCQPPMFVKSDFDQNYVYGTPEAATLTTILLTSIICKYILYKHILINDNGIQYYFSYNNLFGFTSTSKSQNN